MIGWSSRHLSNPDCSGMSRCSRSRYLSSRSDTRLRTEGSIGEHALGQGGEGRRARPRTERAIVVRITREALALASKALTVARAPAGAGARLTALDRETCLGRQRQDGLRPQRRRAVQKEKKRWRAAHQHSARPFLGTKRNCSHAAAGQPQGSSGAHSGGGLRGITKPRTTMVITIVVHVATVSQGVKRNG